MKKITGYPELIELDAIDNNGLPTTYLCFNILKAFFKEPRKYFNTNHLRSLYAAKKKDVELICKQLHDKDFITQNPSNLKEYRYNLNSKNMEKQCNFERFLVEVEVDAVPVHERLPYSPSFR